MVNRAEKSNFYVDMGFRLKQIRQIRGLSQNDLSQSLGVVTQTIQKYESGQIRILPEVIHKCSEVFSVPIGYFYGEGNGQRFTRASLMIAAEVMLIPSNDVQQKIYSLVQSIHQSYNEEK